MWRGGGRIAACTLALSPIRDTLPEAEPLYKRALAIMEKALGPEHPDVGAALNNLAELYRNQGRHAEAEPLYRRSRAIREKALGPEHPAVAKDLGGLALLYQAQGRLGAGEILGARGLQHPSRQGC